MNRNQFLRNTGAGGPVMATARLRSFKNREEETLDKYIVQTFVGASYKDKVKELLQEYPTLPSASDVWNKKGPRIRLGCREPVGFKGTWPFFWNTAPFDMANRSKDFPFFWWFAALP